MSKRAFGSIRSRNLGSDLAALTLCRHIVERDPFRAVAGLVLAAACVLLSNGSAFAQAIDENLWVTNGTISTVVRDGGTIYVGGNFTYVGPATGGGVPLGAASGAPLPSFPKVVGVVLAVVSDGAGGWYLGGAFTLCPASISCSAVESF